MVLNLVKCLVHFRTFVLVVYHSVCRLNSYCFGAIENTLDVLGSLLSGRIMIGSIVNLIEIAHQISLDRIISVSTVVNLV